jgi:ribosome-associated protein
MSASADASSAARAPAPVAVELPITLGQFLKVAGLVGTGGEAKHLIVAGQITVNGETEVRRGRHLVLGDVVAAAGGQAVTLVDEPLDT